MTDAVCGEGTALWLFSFFFGGGEWCGSGVELLMQKKITSAFWGRGMWKTLWDRMEKYT